MLGKICIILIFMAWNFEKIDADLQIIDSRVSSNEIPYFNPKMNSNSINHEAPSTTPNPPPATKPYKFIEEPEDVHAQLGTSITLKCIISHTNGTVQWTKNHFGLGVDRDLMGYKRYSMIGDVDKGSYSLHIIAVNFKDEGFYQCQFANNDVQMRSRYATVTVFRTDEYVKTANYDKLEGNEGKISKVKNTILKFAVIIGVFGVLGLICRKIQSKKDKTLKSSLPVQHSGM